MDLRGIVGGILQTCEELRLGAAGETARSLSDHQLLFVPLLEPVWRI